MRVYPKPMEFYLDGESVYVIDGAGQRVTIGTVVSDPKMFVGDDGQVKCSFRIKPTVPIETDGWICSVGTNS